MENPPLADLLADQLNVLTILGLGMVEFVLNQLNDLATGSRQAGSDVTSRVKALAAMKGLAADDSCRREILARGQPYQQEWCAAILMFVFIFNVCVL